MGPRLFNRGKPLRPTCESLPAHPFNGAAVIQPRKTPQQPWSSCRSSGPSMGPRLFNRGKSYECIESNDAAGLQWGRGYSTAENVKCRRHPARRARPSMGPRLFNRGKLAPPGAGPSAVVAFNGAAVIQPRKREHLRQNEWPNLSLQWGRGYSTAEKRPVSARR